MHELLLEASLLFIFTTDNTSYPQIHTKKNEILS